MPGVAGYKAQLKLGGVPTVFTDEPLTQLGTSYLFRIETVAKRVLSANHAVVVTDDNDNEIDPSKINYLEGVIYFEELENPLPLKISGRYIPLLYIGGSKDYSCEIGGDVLDDSSFHSENTLNAGYRTKVCGIHDISVSFSRWNDFSGKLTEAKLAKTPIFVSINPGASLTMIKGWFQIETDSLSGDIGSLEDEALSLVLCGNNAQTYFSYSYNYADEDFGDMDDEDIYNNYFFTE